MVGSGVAWRDLGTPDELGPGEYRLELVVPDWLLDKFIHERQAMMRRAEGALRTEYPALNVTGGGVQHSTYPGTNVQRRVLVLTVEIKPEENDGDVIETAAVGAIVIRVAVLVAVVAVAWLVRDSIISVQRIAERVPDGAIEDGAEGFKNLVSLAKTVVLGGGLVWLLLKVAGDEKGGNR